MPKKIIFAIVALTLVSLSVSQSSCSDKGIIENSGTNRGKLKNSGISDITKAYNGPASCATLRLDGGLLCCYIKFKFKNEEIDEKFTHKGCYEIPGETTGVINDSEDFDFEENIIDILETKFNNKYQNKYSSKKISIDCSSKYLHLAGFALLFLLL